LASDFDGNVTFISLAAIRVPESVIPTLTQALGIRDEDPRPQLEQLKLMLQTRRQLLLLDNFEQVSTAAVDVVDLLHNCPGLKVLITSREKLHVRGEYEFPLHPLALPDQRHLADLEALTHVPAVALFVQRAQAIKWDFQLTGGNAATIAEICVHLEGLPLAIELAAAYIKLLPPQAMLARLKSMLGARFQLLTGGAQDLPARQQTLYQAIDWSYQLLELEDQRLFRWLGVFRGGCTLAAAEAIGTIAGQPSTAILSRLASLVDKSLLRQVEQPKGEPRLSMLETIREYALEQLAANGETDMIGGIHGYYYLALAEEADSQLSQGIEQALWIERLEPEHDNLRTALSWFQGQGDIERALRLGAALQWFWFIRGHFREGRAWLIELLTFDSVDLGDRTRARALNAAGWLAQAQGDYAMARELGEQSLALFRALNDPAGIAWALNTLGYAYLRQGDLPASLPLLEESISLFRASGNQYGVALPLSIYGFVAFGPEDHARARSLVAESLAICRGLGDTQGMVRALILLGYLALDGQDLVAAGAHFEEALKLSIEMNHPYVIAYSIEGLADVAAAQEQAPLAVQLSSAAATLRETSAATAAASIQARHARYLEQARQALTAEAYHEAWAAGQKLTSAQVSADLSSLTLTQPSPQSPLPAGLTSRELEILRLVAQGLTDAQVAERLVVSPRTVNSHLRSIYSKLGVTSRSAATRYAFEHQLV
jgi:non-specific serine/threonine protein kinase